MGKEVNGEKEMIIPPFKPMNIGDTWDGMQDM